MSFCVVSFNTSDSSFSIQIAEGEALRKAGVQKEVDGRRKEGSSRGTRYPVTRGFWVASLWLSATGLHRTNFRISNITN